jgi:hypothetical protein
MLGCHIKQPEFSRAAIYLALYLSQRFAPALLIAARDNHMRAFIGKLNGRLLADACIGTCHDTYLLIHTRAS